MNDGRTEPHEFFTLWEVDRKTHKIVLKRPANPYPQIALSASSFAHFPGFYVKPPLEQMREARAWLEARKARRADWFAESVAA